MGNLKAYNVKTPTEYYLSLNESLGLGGKELTHFCIFGNAALVLWEPTPVKPQVKELNYQLIDILKSEGVSLWT